jgi:beta-mannosidase
MFACSMFPNTPEHLANIEREAIYNVKRLRKHPSVVFWCGNNENLVGWNNWGWKESFSDENRGLVWAGYRKVFHEILPRAVETYAPELSYWPSSPQSHYDGVMPSNTHGDQHEWSVWFNRQDFSYYGEHCPRFCSEYGGQSYSEMKTILAFAEAQDLDHDSDLMNNRNRCKLDWMSPGKNGNHLIMDYIHRYYRTPRDFEAYVYLSQLMHAKALETGIEAHRAHMPRTMGSLYWQLNDCWPTMSWATVDYFGRWKPGHYAVKRAFEPVQLMARVDSNWVMVYGVSDRPEAVEAQLTLEVKDFSGELLKTENRDVTLAANTSTLFRRWVLPLDEWTLSKKVYMELTLRSSGEVLAHKVLFLRDEKELELPVPEIELTVQSVEGGYALTLGSPVLAAHVVLSTPEVEGFLGENHIHLLPGESRTIHFRTDAQGLSSEDFRVYSLRDSYGEGTTGL